MKIIYNYKDVDFKQIIDLYNSVGWYAYTDNPKSLEAAFKNTDFLQIAIAKNNDNDSENQNQNQNETVIGVTRSISDGVSIHYLQDILIHPSRQKEGIGRKLLNSAMKKYSDVRTHVIMTDDEKKQLMFYKSLGFKNTKDLNIDPLNVFVKMSDVELE